MGELNRKPIKPLHINPIKLSQPMGATLAFLGVDRCMPLMHGALGCASFIKVFLTRHFNEPIAVQTTAVTDITAILDGGDYNIVEAIHNITAKTTPQLIGLHTTGLTETKGDDIRGISSRIDVPLVYVNTPDYEGGLESGWAAATQSMIEQLVMPAEHCLDNRIALLPHVSLQPVAVEKIKEIMALFGFEVFALPDLSTSLDGHLGEKQGALSSGGIAVEDIRHLAQARLVVSIGASMKHSAAALCKKNPQMRHEHFPHVQGLVATDNLVGLLLRESGRDKPPPSVVRWRKRLQDALLDSHFSLGQTRFLVTGEPDQIGAICAALHEAGGRIAAVIASVDADFLEEIAAQNILVGDLEDAEHLMAEVDVIVGNFHAEALAHRAGKGLLLRGFPNWEQIGNALKNDVLYEGSSYFLFEAANTAEHYRARQIHQSE